MTPKQAYMATQNARREKLVNMDITTYVFTYIDAACRAGEFETFINMNDSPFPLGDWNYVIGNLKELGFQTNRVATQIPPYCDWLKVSWQNISLD